MMREKEKEMEWSGSVGLSVRYIVISFLNYLHIYFYK